MPDVRMIVFGRTGQVSSELGRLLGTSIFLNRNILGSPNDVKEVLMAARPYAVVNAAAYTLVDAASDELATATYANSVLPSTAAGICSELGIPFVHISTDYVFDGSGKEPFRPEDVTGPLNTYGQTKLAGEEAVRAAGGTYAILRTSWVFSAHGFNFVKTMLKLSETRDHIHIVGDQFGGPTPAADIAFACLRIAERLKDNPKLSGTYHFSGAPNVSWADFAREIFRQSGRDVTVEEIPTSAYPTRAERPKNSRLNCDTLSVFGLERPDWRLGLSRVLDELGAQK